MKVEHCHMREFVYENDKEEKKKRTNLTRRRILSEQFYKSSALIKPSHRTIRSYSLKSRSPKHDPNFFYQLFIFFFFFHPRWKGFSVLNYPACFSTIKDDFIWARERFRASLSKRQPCRVPSLFVVGKCKFVIAKPVYRGNRPSVCSLAPEISANLIKCRNRV